MGAWHHVRARVLRAARHAHLASPACLVLLLRMSQRQIESFASSAQVRECAKCATEVGTAIGAPCFRAYCRHERLCSLCVSSPEQAVSVLLRGSLNLVELRLQCRVVVCSRSHCSPGALQACTTIIVRSLVISTLTPWCIAGLYHDDCLAAWSFHTDALAHRRPAPR